MNTKIEFAQRLKQAMLDAGYEARPSVLEREFNQRYWGNPVTFQAVRHWLRGDAMPEQDKLQALAEWLSIEPQVLRFGGEATRKVQEKKDRWEEAIAGAEREVIEAFLRLPTPQRKVAREVILALAKANAPSARER